MNEQTYIYKKLIGDSYVPCDESSNLLEIQLNPSSKFNSIFEIFKQNDNVSFNAICLPKECDELLTLLLNKYHLPEDKDDFISLLVYFQHYYLSIFQIPKNEEIKGDLEFDFFEERKDLEHLMAILEKVVYSENNKNLHSISFKFKKSETLSVKNFFLVKDIYDFIIQHYGLTKENFSSRKEKIISLAVDASLYRKTKEELKLKIINVLYSYLIEKKFSQSSSLKFIGVFLDICQVKSNNGDEPIFEISSPLDFKLQLKSVDIKNLRIYMKRKTVNLL